ncbi:hypothetical protein GH714_034604 [Hevea brasiliensis]|uniref:Uncharacterized protein n=1 Tax=Hevea brasiliensis TaxID=3981 RepID=A0A6A6MFF1_HEVBR|nr:hypothetical protein GH714_034604 [Hevea brasiliensis]
MRTRILRSSKSRSRFPSPTTLLYQPSRSARGLWGLLPASFSFLNQFFWYRREPLTITSISAQIAVVPLGHLMASTITDKFFFKGTKWEFSLNPGPFNMKEHVLITIFANSGAGNVYAIHIVSAVKIFYRKELTFIVAFLVVITTQVLGFGWAGLFRRYLVEPAAMWWPQNLVQVSLFRRGLRQCLTTS